MATSHSTARSTRGEPDGRAALDHWLAQEQQAADVAQDDDLLDLLAGQRMPSGWWMLPVLVMALPIWSFLIWMIMRT